MQKKLKEILWVLLMLAYEIQDFIDKKEYDMSKILLFWYTGQNEYLKGKCDGKKRKMVTVGG